MIIITRLNALLPLFPNITHQALDEALSTHATSITRIKRIKSLLKEDMALSLDEQITCDLDELLRALKHKVDAHSKQSENIYDVLPFIDKKVQATNQCYFALWSSYCTKHVKDVNAWILTLDTSLEDEQTPLHLLPLIYNTHLDSPIKFAGWLTYFLKQSKTAEDILATGFLHDYFDLSLINLADLTKGYGFFKATLKPTDPYYQEGRLLLEKAANMGANRLGYELLALDGSVSDEKLDVSQFNLIRARELTVEFTLNTRNLENLHSLFGFSFFLYAVLRCDKTSNQSLVFWCKNKFSNFSIQDVSVFCRMVMTEVPEKQRPSLLSGLNFCLSEYIAKQLLASNTISPWIIFYMKPNLAPLWDKESFEQFLLLNPISSTLLFAVTSLLKKHTSVEVRGYILGSVFVFCLHNPQLEIDITVLRQFYANRRLTQSLCEQALRPMKAALEACIESCLPLTDTSYLTIYGLYRSHMTIRSLILQIMRTEIEYPKDKYELNAYIIESAYDLDPPDKRIELESLLNIMHPEPISDTETYTHADTMSAQKKTILECLAISDKTTVLSAGIELLQIRYGLLEWDQEYTRGKSVFWLAMSSERYLNLLNQLAHPINHHFWIKVLYYFIEIEQIINASSFDWTKRWLKEQLDKMSFTDLAALYNEISFRNLDTTKASQLFNVLGTYLSNETALLALQSGAISPWFILCSKPDLFDHCSTIIGSTVLTQTTAQAGIIVLESCKSLFINLEKSARVLFDFYWSHKEEIPVRRFVQYAQQSPEIQQWCQEKLAMLDHDLKVYIESNSPLTTENHSLIATYFNHQQKAVLQIQRLTPNLFADFKPQELTITSFEHLLYVCSPYPETLTFLLSLCSIDKKSKIINPAILCKAAGTPESLRILLALCPNKEALLAAIKEHKEITGYPHVLLSAFCNLDSITLLFQLYPENERANMLLRGHQKGMNLMGYLLMNGTHDYAKAIFILSQMIMQVPVCDQFRVVEGLINSNYFVTNFPTDDVLKSVLKIKIATLKNDLDTTKSHSFFSHKRKFQCTTILDKINQLEDAINTAPTTNKIQNCYHALQAHLKSNEVPIKKYTIAAITAAKSISQSQTL